MSDDSVERFRRLVALNAPLPLAESCLLIGDVEPSEWLPRLDRLAEQCDSADASAVVAALFGQGRFAGNSVDFYDPDNVMLHRVLDRKLGMPIVLAIIAIEVGARLGVTFDGTPLPGHFLIEEHGTGRYFDPFHGGRELTAGGCRAFTRALTGSDYWTDEWIQPSTSEAIVQRVLLNLKGIAHRRRRYPLLKRVMQMRLSFPELASERDDFRRLMAAFN